MCCTSCVLVVMVGLADGGARGGLLFVVFDICGWSPACTSQTNCPRGGGGGIDFGGGGGLPSHCPLAPGALSKQWPGPPGTPLVPPGCCFTPPQLYDLIRAS